MDMKRILQAFDSTATKKVEGASNMSKFLQIVKEASQAPVAPTAPVQQQTPGTFKSPYPQFATITQAPDGTFTITYLQPNLAASGTADDSKVNPPMTNISTYEKAKEIVTKDYNLQADIMSMPSSIQVKEMSFRDYVQQIEEGLKDPKDNPCWKGYKPVGTKQKGGRTVPNCVPKE